MNWLGLATVAIGFAGFLLGRYCAAKSMSRNSALLIAFGAALFAIPAIVYDLYYAKLFGEPIWLYRIRVIPGSELAASFAGFLAGWAQVRAAPRLRLSSLGKRFLVPVVLGFALALPYLKPVLRPLRFNTLREQWKDEACLQSTLATCGPASSATVVRRLGGHLSEHDLAKEAFTCRSGTENWYLARALRQHGLQTSFLLTDPLSVPLPAVAGVRLRSLGGSGHFIALLDRHGSNFVVADPMEGLLTNTLAELRGVYDFTGFFLQVQRPK